jgi:tetratricopeptide (TPR) repeat protein
MYNLLGTTSAALGDFDIAYEACRRELELNEQLGYESYVASAHGNLAEVAMRLGDMPAAAGHQRSCLDLAVAQGSPGLVAFSLIVAARIAGWQQDWTTAVALHAKAEEQLEEIGLVLYEDDLRESEELLDLALEQLGDKPLMAARSHGLEMTLPDAVQSADEVLARAQQAL